jgi:hypothetical protein
MNHTSSVGCKAAVHTVQTAAHRSSTSRDSQGASLSSLLTSVNGSRLAGHKAIYVDQCKLTHWRHRKTIDEWSGVYYGRPSSHARVACTLKTPHRDAQYETKLHCWQLAQLLSPPHRIKHHTIINSPYVP